MLKGYMYQFALKRLYFAAYTILPFELIKTVNVDIRYGAFVANRSAKIFSGNQLFQYWVKNQHFRDLLHLRH
jgi:hypothetical protein